ncbi:hypothetical protein OG389_08655 [Streptomyces sp. NBC_00435]|uniref:hypothetical protein n=1 Tax=Streptomyces sp. NBC_00435 TaxID=2903649 RepID=UPI002E1D6F41
MGGSAWATRYWGGGALLFAVLALWRLLLGAGVSVYRPEVADGMVVEVHRLKVNEPKARVLSGDVTVEVPRFGPGEERVGTTRLEVLNGHLGAQRALGDAYRAGQALDGPQGPSATWVPVLYAPTAPRLGGVVDAPGHIERYLGVRLPVRVLPAAGRHPDRPWGRSGPGVLRGALPRPDPAGRTRRPDPARRRGTSCASPWTTVPSC